MPSALTVTFVQSTVLNALSNILAQLIDQRNNTTPFKLNILALLQFVSYGILIVPLNFYWQRALETQYPGFPSRAEISTLFSSRSCSFKALCSLASLRSFVVSLWPWSADSDAQLPHHREKEKEKMAEIQEQTQGQASSRWAPRVRKSGLHAFMMKFLFDQTVAGVVNIVLFVFLINVLKGVALGRVWELIIEDFRPIMIARMKYRPIVSTLMYTVIPVDRRVVFGSACGVIWGIYLSLYAAV
ncbi:hypothetical protein N7509_002957 [Penicillium cosmopolitanum]|uniref:Uncharacterized protein n=1 Tax=Penicillium cosmopolitanum TaxID=1131564 RepID=A0A9W9WA16_9EURO|nr:uncharacterized protein N7509_002957 [Penicillium cosmopolitanum]KAJ5409074.1 hypothetical protein N7509_002957 [Penicillium cosmopolitanum]